MSEKSVKSVISIVTSLVIISLLIPILFNSFYEAEFEAYYIKSLNSDNNTKFLVNATTPSDINNTYINPNTVNLLINYTDYDVVYNDSYLLDFTISIGNFTAVNVSIGFILYNGIYQNTFNGYFNTSFVFNETYRALLPIIVSEFDVVLVFNHNIYDNTTIESNSYIVQIEPNQLIDFVNSIYWVLPIFAGVIIVILFSKIKKGV